MCDEIGLGKSRKTSILICVGITSMFVVVLASRRLDPSYRDAELDGDA